VDKCILCDFGGLCVIPFINFGDSFSWVDEGFFGLKFGKGKERIEDVCSFVKSCNFFEIWMELV
jgi:hypothetical protein